MQRIAYPDRILVDRDVMEKNISQQCKCGNTKTFESWEMKGKAPSPTMVLKCSACKRQRYFNI